MATLTLDSVDKIYRSRGKEPVHAVRQVNLRMTDGEIVGLLGSSGCGKTSTLRMIAGFEDVSAGEIRLGDRLLNPLRPAQRNVAMAFEGYALYPPLTIRDNIAFGLLRDRRPKSEVDARVRQIAELLEITDILDRYPPTISGGQQQRTSLARALVRNADLFLLDEPMSQLEPQLRAVLRARIKDWLIEHKMTTVFVTHDQTEALALADRIAVMEGGVLQQLATPRDLKDKPANLFVASFIGEPPMNTLEARVERTGGGLRLVGRNPAGADAFALDLPVSADEPLSRSVGARTKVVMGIRPHLVEADPSGPLTGTVFSNQWLGDQTHLGLDVGGVSLITVTDAAIEAPLQAALRLRLPVEALHLFDVDSGVALTHGREAA
ncbi:MAG: ABC transporter ATP-binding protein [Geminicoccaceae bacterium]